MAYEHWDNQPPPPVDWPYWWSAEYDIEHLPPCICGGSGELPNPDGETALGCHECTISD